MITNLVVKVQAGSIHEATERAAERLGIVEAVFLWNESPVHKGAGEFIAYRESELTRAALCARSARLPGYAGDNNGE